MRPIPYGRQHITEDDIRAVTDVLRSDFLTQGPKIGEFERAFCETVGAHHAVAVSNATAALHIGAIALGVKPGQKIITTPLSFVATANGVRYCGAEVVFSDIDPETYLLDLDKLEKLLSSHPRGTFAGIIMVDFAGLPVDAEAFRRVAHAHDLWIMQDACHAIGGAFRNSHGETIRCGDARYADLTVFSFHPVKHIAAGEGGMITTRSKELYEKLLLLRTHGITKRPELFELENQGGWYFEMQELGYNYRLTDIQAALGMSQLARLGSQLERRRELAANYDRAFQGTRVRPAPTQSGRQHAYHLYVIQVPNRKKVYDFLAQNQILAQVHYIPIHLMPNYRKLGWKPGDFPNAEAYYEHALSLPMFPTLSDEDQKYVIEKVLESVS